jgi:hypothetical protein
MELFGHLCSPLCKAKAEANGIDVPVFEGQKSVIEKKFWRKVNIGAGSLGALVLAFLGLWIWYAWFGSHPGVTYSVRFPERAHSGQSWFCGESRLAFLHGGTLAVHDLKAKKELWRRELIDVKRIDEEVAKEVKEAGGDAGMAEELKADAMQAAAERLEMRVHGNNLWVLSPGKLVRYDMATGNPSKELALPRENVLARGDELLMMAFAQGKQTITRIDLLTGETSTEQTVDTPAATTGADPTSPANVALAVPGRRSDREMGGLPLGTPGKDAGKPMDPRKVEAQAQRLSRPARIALPALLANSMNQERIMAEMGDEDERPSPGAGARPKVDRTFVQLPTSDGFIQLSVRLLESRIVQRSAMQAKPAKSVLDGNLNVTQTAEVANEILNDMQRSRGGDIVREDESRYLVKIRRADATAEWAGEVIGPPRLFALRTVNVLSANKIIYVFNKDNKMIWESPLSYNIDADLPMVDEQNSGEGLGPCVEHRSSLYVFDEGVLTAFDLASGKVRWRLPSVGVQGVLFDGEGMMYVNTTTGSPDQLKFSRQIDVSRQTAAETIKLDPVDGRIIWREHLGGYISYIAGKFIYTLSFYQPADEEERGPRTGFEMNAYLRIKRINPRTGMELWEHFQQRAPLSVDFDGNRIGLVFRKEVQVLKFLSL